MKSTESAAAEPNLETLRVELDEIDRTLLQLLARRQQVVDQVGEVKRKQMIAPLQPARWQAVLFTRKEYGKEVGLAQAFVTDIWERIHEEALQREQEIISRNTKA